MYATEEVYRKTTSEGATGFSLMVALYDTLAGDLRRAAEAERCNNIEKRCNEVKHALLVIAHLEDWISQGSGGELADKLTAFYSTLRRKMILAQARRSPEILEEQMFQVLDLRKMWHELDVRSASAVEVPSWVNAQEFSSNAPARYERSASSWSA